LKKYDFQSKYRHLTPGERLRKASESQAPWRDLPDPQELLRRVSEAPWRIKRQIEEILEGPWR